VGPLAGKIFLVDVKTLSPCDVYTDNQTGEPNAAVNARQKRVNQDYHSKAQRLDEQCGCNENNGFKARLNSFGQDGRVLGPVIGAFGEMSSGVEHIAEKIATELASEHCTYVAWTKKTRRCGPTSASSCTNLGAWQLTADEHASCLTAGALSAPPSTPATARAAIIPVANTTKRPRMIAI